MALRVRSERITEHRPQGAGDLRPNSLAYRVRVYVYAGEFSSI